MSREPVTQESVENPKVYEHKILHKLYRNKNMLF